VVSRRREQKGEKEEEERNESCSVIGQGLSREDFYQHIPRISCLELQFFKATSI